MDFNIPYERDEFIERLKQRNAATYNVLYDKYAPALYTVILQIVRDEQIANNLLEKCFTEIADKIYTYNPHQGRLFIWLFKIARNVAIDIIRSMNNPQVLEQEAKETFEKIATLQIDNYGLKKAIMKLKAEQRILLDLCYYKGYTHEEMAVALNIPVETVNKKLQVAVVALRAFI